MEGIPNAKFKIGPNETETIMYTKCIYGNWLPDIGQEWFVEEYGLFYALNITSYPGCSVGKLSCSHRDSYLGWVRTGFMPGVRMWRGTEDMWWGHT